MDRKENPCSLSTDYNLASCIFKKMTANVGCKPFWMKDPSNAILTPCNSPEESRKYLLELLSLVFVDDAEFRNITGCLKPCNFMEYKVRW